MSIRARSIVIGVTLVVALATWGLLRAVAEYGIGPLAKGAGEASYADLRRLDAYAEELGLVMGRSSGSADNHAARVDGPGRDLEVLVAEGDEFEDGAEVVLRLRIDHVEDGLRFLGDSGADESTVSVCYRWVFASSVDDYRPDRLDECPAGPVITVTPTPGPTYDGG